MGEDRDAIELGEPLDPPVDRLPLVPRAVGHVDGLAAGDGVLVGGGVDGAGEVLVALLLGVPEEEDLHGELADFSALLASILLIAPALVHRLTFRLGQKAYIVLIANRLAIAGLSVFALAMTSAVLLVTHYLFGAVTAIVTTAVVVICFGLIWFALPLHHRRLRRRPPA